jgi:putative intracellular protease/amidase
VSSAASARRSRHRPGVIPAKDLKAEDGRPFVAAPAFQPHAVRDGNLITCQQHSGAETARLVIEALEE